jgi:hypothetical protein
MPQAASLTVILGLATALGLWMIPPIAQDMAYHDLADKRPFMGIANFGDVGSNLAFIIAGFWGWATAYRRQLFQFRGERYIWYSFFASVVMVGFGSSYYHLTPSNATLAWDRLPMTLAFMSFFSYIIMERIDPTTGFRFFPSLLLLGVASIWYWDYTESLGNGDLRPYAWVQFFPMLVIPLLLIFTKARYSNGHYFYAMLACYAASKLLEHFDSAIFVITNGYVSGHTLKHLVAAMSIGFIGLYVQRRNVIPLR